MGWSSLSSASPSLQSTITSSNTGSPFLLLFAESGIHISALRLAVFAKINVYQLYFIFSATFKSDYMICRFRILGGSGARDCFVSFDCVFLNLTQVFISKIGKKFLFLSYSLMAIGVELN